MAQYCIHLMILRDLVTFATRTASAGPKCAASAVVRRVVRGVSWRFARLPLGRQARP